MLPASDAVLDNTFDSEWLSGEWCRLTMAYSCRVLHDTDYFDVVRTDVRLAGGDVWVTSVAGTATAVEPAGGTTYTLNDTGVNLPPDAKPSLLFDSIIESEDSTARTDALKVQVDKKLGTVGSNTNRYYEIKYLDLVDANNGNAWITSSAGTDIYWAYPNGTDENTEFTLLHFEGLHRDGTDSGFMIEDISKVEPEKIEVAKTPQGIKFHIGAGGFSPFALVWEDNEDDPDVPVNPPVDPNPPSDPDGPDDLNTEEHYSYICLLYTSPSPRDCS